MTNYTGYREELIELLSDNHAKAFKVTKLGYICECTIDKRCCGKNPCEDCISKTA